MGTRTRVTIANSAPAPSALAEITCTPRSKRAVALRASLIEQQLGVAEIVTLLRQRVREGLSAEADLRKFETEHTTLRISIARTTVSLESALIRLGMDVVDLGLVRDEPASLQASLVEKCFSTPSRSTSAPPSASGRRRCART